ncbi:hypothetical protein D9M68_862660 [compost metagenome]
MKRRAESESDLVLPRLDSTNTVIKDWTTRKAFSGLSPWYASVYRLSRPVDLMDSESVTCVISLSCSALDLAPRSRSAMRISFSTVGRLMSVRLSILTCCSMLG